MEEEHVDSIKRRREGVPLMNTRQGHFLYPSGRHGESYIDKFAVLQHPEIVSGICEGLAQDVRDLVHAGYGVDAPPVTLVVGPQTGGVIVAYELARALNARWMIANSNRSGWSPVTASDHVVVADDVLTTGSTILPVIADLQERGATVVGAVVLFDRRHGSWLELGVPIVAHEAILADNFTAKECPLCAANVPLEVVL
jgi:orotate phosphoribosyltransferase